MRTLQMSAMVVHARQTESKQWPQPLLLCWYRHKTGWGHGSERAPDAEFAVLPHARRAARRASHHRNRTSPPAICRGSRTLTGGTRLRPRWATFVVAHRTWTGLNTGTNPPITPCTHEQARPGRTRHPFHITKGVTKPA